MIMLVYILHALSSTARGHTHKYTHAARAGMSNLAMRSNGSRDRDVAGMQRKANEIGNRGGTLIRVVITPSIDSPLLREYTHRNVDNHAEPDQKNRLQSSEQD